MFPSLLPCATLSLLTPEFYQRLNGIAEKIEAQLRPFIEEKGFSFARVGSMFTIFFRSEAPRSYTEVKECDFKTFGRFHAIALSKGLYFPPSQYEAVFLAACMSDEDIEFLVEKTKESILLL